MSRTHFTTPKGTELPLMNMRGKEYLEVKYRLVWFREDHPTWSVQTTLVERTDKSALFKAEIFDETGRTVATSHKFEDRQGFADFIEKAETGSIGRALALVGYGTQFAADELDEGERIVDSPAAPTKHAPISAPAGGPEGYRINFGKFKGKTMGSIDPAELNDYAAYLYDGVEQQKRTPNTKPSVEVDSFLKAYEALCKQRNLG